jgi:hypothetical protein
MLALQKWLLVVQSLGFAAVVLRLLASGLWKTYRFFLVYLVLASAQSGIPYLVGPRSALYMQLFLLSEILILFSYALVLRELYSLILANLPGIASTARRYMQIVLGLSIVASFFVILAEKNPAYPMEEFLKVERIVLFALMIFVFLLTAFVLYYPVPLNRNVIYYSIGYAFYFSFKAGLILVFNISGAWFKYLSLGALSVCAACLCFWALSLSAAGERRRATVGHQWNPGDDQRLLRQLEAINASLVHSRK